MEMNFNDAGRFDARAQNVLLRRHVVFRAQSLEVIEEASNRATHMSTMSTRTGKLATCGAHSQAWRLGGAAERRARASHVAAAATTLDRRRRSVT